MIKLDLTGKIAVVTGASGELGPAEIITNNAVLQYNWKHVLEQDAADYQSQYKTSVLHNLFMTKVFILKYPKIGNCRWFSDSKVSFCGISTSSEFCVFHQKENRERISRGIVDSNPLQVYYSNLQNLEQLNEESFRQFTDSGIYLVENIIKDQQALELFALNPSATFSRITHRFRYLVKESHPDTGGDSDYSFQDIKEAYNVLSMWKK